MKTTRKAGALAIAVFFTTTVARGESFTGGQNNNPFANVIGSGSNAPVSNPGDAKFFSSTSNIVDDSAGNAANGREYKLADAQKQAGAGVGAAITAGSLLAAAGAQQLAMLNFPEAARLFGLSGMEFAQAAATSSSGTQNGDQRSMLLAEANQSGKQYNPQEIAQNLLTPEAKQALAAQGINPESFMNQLASGSVRSGTDAAALMGQNPAVFTTDVNDYSGVDFGSILGGAENLGEMDREMLGIQEDADSNPFASNNSGSGGGSSSPGSSLQFNDARGNDAGAMAGGSTASLQQGPQGAGTGPQADAANLARGLASIDESGAYRADLAGKLDPKHPANLIDRAQLLSIGVTRSRGQHIFRVANRNYRSFSKWRIWKPSQRLKSENSRVVSKLN